jgi:hypothetical protein
MAHKITSSLYIQLKFTRLILLVALSFCYSCQSKNDESQKGDKLFTLLSPATTGIEFSNDVKYTEELNVYTFRNFYNGGGVGIADINNDSLPDVFLCGNMKSNKLYLNKGNLNLRILPIKQG